MTEMQIINEAMLQTTLYFWKIRENLIKDKLSPGFATNMPYTPVMIWGKFSSHIK